MIIALTGGIGCGKSLALQYFSDLGWRVVSADALAHEIYNQDKEFIDTLVGRWGAGVVVPEGGIDRRAVAGIVFREPEQLAWLTGVLHPKILSRAEVFFAAAPDANHIFEVPLLYETGWQERYDAVIGIWSDPAKTHERLLARGMSEEDIDRRMKLQMSADLKLEKADFALINNGSPDDLYEQCRILTEQIMKEKIWKSKIR